MEKTIRIGTRESQLAVWQAATVKQLLEANNFKAELVYIKSEGDTDLKTPLYEIGVQGIFTRALDIALLNNEIDIAVHSMKDVPTVMAKGIVQLAVLDRASQKDILVIGPGYQSSNTEYIRTIATSSVRRRAQWLNRYPTDKIDNLRGNVNTRLRKVAESDWHGAIFAAAGLERINLKPENAIELDWMLPAPAQGAIMVVAREGEHWLADACLHFNHDITAACVKVERDFLRALMGGCTTPISGYAQIIEGDLYFDGNLLSKDGKDMASVSMVAPASDYLDVGEHAAKNILANGGQDIIASMNNVL